MDQEIVTELPEVKIMDHNNKISARGIIIDIISIPAFLVLFVISMLYAGITFVFRVK